MLSQDKGYLLFAAMLQNSDSETLLSEIQLYNEFKSINEPNNEFNPKKHFTA
jgi:hypothetical protein